MKQLVYGCCALALSVSGAGAQEVSGDEVVIGVLTGFAGGVGAVDGEGAVVAAQMAIDEFGGQILGKPIRLLKADHQNKPDVALTVARSWFDQDGVDAITNLNLSNVALAVMSLVDERERIAIVTSAVSSAITAKDCSPLTVHWGLDTYTQTQGLPDSVVKNGGDSWYFLTVDNAFGKSLEADTTAAVTKAGGKVVGSVVHPFLNQDFSSFVLQAQSSGSNVIALANSSQDLQNAIRQASEFGVTQTLVPFFFFQDDVRSLGLDITKGIVSQVGFYWDLNDETRKFSQAFFDRFQKMPENNQAMQYTSVLHYLKAVEAAGTDEAKAVRAKMGELPINDMTTTDGSVRADGRAMRDFYTVQVKSPDESTGEWDVFKPLGKSTREALYRPASESECRLLKQ